MKKIVLSLLLILPFLLNSCEGNGPNELEKYEGIWNAALTLTTSIDGEQSMITESSSQVEITAGENVIYIDQSSYKVSGNIITMPKTTLKNSLMGMIMETTTEADGTITDDKIEIQQIINTKVTYPDETVMNTKQIIDMILTK